MKTSRIRPLCVVFPLLALLGGGCVSNRLYTGPALPSAQTARLETRQIGTWLLRFDNLQGPVKNTDKQTGWPAPRVFEIPGGTHTLSVQYIGSTFLYTQSTTNQPSVYVCRTFTSPPVTLAFDAQPGHRYLVTASANLATASCCPMVVDLSVGGKVASAGPVALSHTDQRAVPGPGPGPGPRPFGPPPIRFR